MLLPQIVEQFKNRNFKHKILNIENSPRCTLLCPACKRTTYFDLHNTKTVPGRDLTVEEFKKCIKYFNKINFCGQLSDPIYGKHFIEFLEICHETNTFCQIATAASSRSEQWYRKAFLANTTAKWIFGIDGPPHLSHLHRINQDGEKLFRMMCLAKELGLNPEWQIIIFQYNEDKIDECIKLAKKHKLDIDLIISSRNVPDHLIPKDSKYNVVRG